MNLKVAFRMMHKYGFSRAERSHSSSPCTAAHEKIRRGGKSRTATSGGPRHLWPPLPLLAHRAEEAVLPSFEQAPDLVKPSID